MKLILKDISLYFKCSAMCCNSEKGLKVLVQPLQKIEPILEMLNDLKHLEIFEFCVTYQPNPNSNLTNEYDLREKLDKWVKRNTKKQKNYVILLMPEYSKTGALHWHGMMYFDNANHYHCYKLIRYLNRVIGRTAGEPVKNYENYSNYMLKDGLKPTIHNPIVYRK